MLFYQLWTRQLTDSFKESFKPLNFSCFFKKNVCDYVYAKTSCTYCEKFMTKKVNKQTKYHGVAADGDITLSPTSSRNGTTGQQSHNISFLFFGIYLFQSCPTSVHYLSLLLILYRVEGGRQFITGLSCPAAFKNYRKKLECIASMNHLIWIFFQLN